jgi:glycine/D-amino acid oxidase-like deaminating enzyme
VVGGGIAGVCAAFRLAAAGARVVLLEQRQLAAATTGQSSAVIGAFYGAAAECRLALATLSELERFGEEVGGDPAFRQAGLLELAAAADAGPLAESVELRQAAGAEIELLDPAAVTAACPAVLVDDICLAAFERRAGFVDPVALTRAYGLAVQRRGGTVQEHCGATALVVADGRVRGVETADGRISSDAVVVANGIGAVDLLHPLGIDLGLMPRSVQYARVASVAPLPPGLPAILDDSQAFWLRADGDQLITGLEFVPPGLLSDQEARRYAALCQRKLRRRLDVGLSPSLLSYGTATVGMSPDGRPIVDRAPGIDGLFLMVGDSGISLKFAPISGRCVAEWYMTGAPRSADISPFSAARLHDGGSAVTLRPGGHRRTIHLIRELQAAARQVPD